MSGGQAFGRSFGRGHFVAHLEMPLAKVSLGAASPGAHEIVVQSCADERTGDRNEASRPFLDDFGAGLRGDALNHAGHEAVDYFFFEKFATDVDSGGTGGGDPQLSGFFFAW